MAAAAAAATTTTTAKISFILFFPAILVAARSRDTHRVPYPVLRNEQVNSELSEIVSQFSRSFVVAEDLISPDV